MQDCGVRKLTVVDSGRVVVSNLARQSLYTSDDRGAPKATAIVKHLVERCPSVVSLHFLPLKAFRWKYFHLFLLLSCLMNIYHDPLQDAQGIQMEIPMPGHPLSPGEAAGVLQDCKSLEELVASHDAIFLLTDTRESRWLPTLLCTNENKVNLVGILE